MEDVGGALRRRGDAEAPARRAAQAACARGAARGDPDGGAAGGRRAEGGARGESEGGVRRPRVVDGRLRRAQKEGRQDCGRPPQAQGGEQDEAQERLAAARKEEKKTKASAASKVKLSTWREKVKAGRAAVQAKAKADAEEAQAQKTAMLKKRLAAVQQRARDKRDAAKRAPKLLKRAQQAEASLERAPGDLDDLREAEELREARRRSYGRRRSRRPSRSDDDGEGPAKRPISGQGRPPAAGATREGDGSACHTRRAARARAAAGGWDLGHDVEDLQSLRAPSFDCNLGGKRIEVLPQQQYLDKSNDNKPTLIWASGRVTRIADGFTTKRSKRAKQVLPAGAVLSALGMGCRS